MALLLEMIVKFTPKHAACLFVCFSAINPCGYLSLALYWLKIACGKARMASILAGGRRIFLLSTLVAVPFLLKFKGLLQHLCFIWALSTLWATGCQQSFSFHSTGFTQISHLSGCMIPRTATSTSECSSLRSPATTSIPSVIVSG